MTRAWSLLAASLGAGLLGACGGDDAPKDPVASYRAQATTICIDTEAAESDLVVQAGSVEAFGAGEVKLVREEVAKLRALDPPASLAADAGRFLRALAYSQGLDPDGNAVPPKSKLDPAKEQLDAGEQAKALATKLGLPACAK